MSFLLMGLLWAAGAAQPIRQVDFRNFTYSGTCTSEEGRGLRVTKGVWEKGEESFEVRAVAYGDLDGDGQEEAVVDTTCSGGGTGRFTDGYVFRWRNGQAEFITHLGLGDRADGGLHQARIAGGLLYDSRYGGRGGACCPDYIDTTPRRLQGNRLVAAAKPVRSDYISRDGQFATRRVQFVRGRSGTTLQGSTSGREVYLIGARAGQTMKLLVTGSNLAISFSGPGDTGAEPQPNVAWSAKLSEDGDYRLTVTPAQGTESVQFSIAIEIR